MSIMAHPGKPILVDTNTIIEAHRVQAWPTLANHYRVETVEDCVMETQTGFQNRPPKQQIDAKALRSSLKEVHLVGGRERVALRFQLQGISLDLGEESLWAHALGRNDSWMLCGPDIASMRAGIRLGFRDRLTSLEWLFNGIGLKPKTALRPAYTKEWLRKMCSRLVVEEVFN